MPSTHPCHDVYRTTPLSPATQVALSQSSWDSQTAALDALLDNPDAMLNDEHENPPLVPILPVPPRETAETKDKGVDENNANVNTHSNSDSNTNTNEKNAMTNTSTTTMTKSNDAESNKDKTKALEAVARYQQLTQQVEPAMPEAKKDETSNETDDAEKETAAQSKESKSKNEKSNKIEKISTEDDGNDYDDDDDNRFTLASEIDFDNDLDSILLPGCKRCFDGARRDHFFLCPKSPQFDIDALKLCVRGVEIDCPRCVDEYLRGTSSTSLHARDCPRHKANRHARATPKASKRKRDATPPAANRKPQRATAAVTTTGIDHQLIDMDDLENLVLPCCEACVAGRKTDHLERLCPKAEDFNALYLSKLAKGLQVKCQSCLVEYYKKYNKNIPHCRECPRSMRKPAATTIPRKRKTQKQLITDTTPAFCLCQEKETPSKQKRHSRLCYLNEEFDKEYRGCIVECANLGCERCEIDYRMGISKAKNGGYFRRDDCLYWNYLKPNELLRTISEDLLICLPVLVRDSISKRKNDDENEKSSSKKQKPERNMSTATQPTTTTPKKLPTTKSTEKSTKTPKSSAKKKAKQPTLKKGQELTINKEARQLREGLQSKKEITMDELMSDTSRFCYKCKTKMGHSHHIFCPKSPKYDEERLLSLLEGTNKGCKKCRTELLTPKIKGHGYDHVQDCPLYEGEEDDEGEREEEKEEPTNEKEVKPLPIRSIPQKKKEPEAVVPAKDPGASAVPEQTKVAESTTKSKEEPKIPASVLPEAGSETKSISPSAKTGASSQLVAASSQSVDESKQGAAHESEKIRGAAELRTTEVLPVIPRKKPKVDEQKAMYEPPKASVKPSSPTALEGSVNYTNTNAPKQQQQQQQQSVKEAGETKLQPPSTRMPASRKHNEPDGSAAAATLPQQVVQAKKIAPVIVDKTIEKPQTSFFPPVPTQTHRHLSSAKPERRFNPYPFAEGSRYRETHNPHDVNVLILKRPPGTLWGFAFDYHESGGACFVTAVHQQSPAASAQFLGSTSRTSLRKQDMILSINGTQVGGLTKGTVEAMFKSAASGIQLVVARFKVDQVEVDPSKAVPAVSRNQGARPGRPPKLSNSNVRSSPTEISKRSKVGIGTIQDEKKECEDDEEEEPDPICVCGETHDDEDTFWIQCDKCEVWHCVVEDCVGFNEEEAIELQKYECLGCTGPQRKQSKSNHEYFIGDVVKVSDQAISSGGVGRVIGKRTDSHGDRVYDIRYVLGGKAKNIAEGVIDPHGWEGRRSFQSPES